MKYYVQFLKVNMAGEIDEQLGSDGIFILDGRNNLYTMIQAAFDRIHALRHVKKHIAGFDIMKGDLRNSVNIHRYLKNSHELKALGFGVNVMPKIARR
jgi:hypothetical protein